MASESKYPLSAAKESEYGRAGREHTVVALGASSGGLDALEAFFRNVSPDSGISYLVAMHLSAGHESRLATILQAFVPMPVTEVTDTTEIEPDHVYVISPGLHLSFCGDFLEAAAHGQSSAAGVIDHLFTTLAENGAERAVGVVLSGAGNDGTTGIRAIKERGGFVFAQDPDEAAYAAMPQSIIASGLVDFVLPVAEMPAQLVVIRDQAARLTAPALDEELPPTDEQALMEILAQVRASTGYSISHYKRSTLRRQIERRMLVLGLESLPDYAGLIQKSGEEAGLLFRILHVSVTRFFRDPVSFRVLAQKVLSSLWNNVSGSETARPGGVRVWVPGCATGEEAYSLAMVLIEQQHDARNGQVRVFATDIDAAALANARQGRYSGASIANIDPARVKRFFEKTDDGAFVVGSELRSAVVFAVHDVTCDPPFAQIDLLSCRNVLIYFQPGMQRQVLGRFAFSLRKGGVLFLGTAEGAGVEANVFQPISRNHRLYRRTGEPSSDRPRQAFSLAHAFRKMKDNPDGTEDYGSDAMLQQGASPTQDGESDSLASNDALILANQEMQSLNEELRSMMEELEVAKEEMQSLNEELTMVNEELRNKVEEHRRVNADLHILIESTHMATLFLDHDLKILLFTPESTTLFNLLPVDKGRPLEHLSHRLSYDGILDDARKVLDEGTEVRREVQCNEGHWYAMRVMPYTTTDGPPEGVVLTFADITSQKMVEQADKDRFSLAFHAGPMAASIVSCRDSRFMDVNDPFQRITGYDRADVVGQSAHSFGLFFAKETELDVEERTNDGTRLETEVQIRSKSGALHDLVVSSTIIDYEGQPAYLSLFHDVTERKRLEREILHVSDREQRRIGVDLHDGLGTHLTGVALLARGLARKLRTGKTIRADDMEEIARLLGDGIEQARTLAQGLNPFLLEVRGLTNALRELAANVETQAGIPCTFEEESAGTSFNSDQSIHLYRITQEAVTNAIRHGKPSKIRISLKQKEHRHQMIIQDDGLGFRPNSHQNARSVSGMGLSIMRYRAHMIGARLTVASTPRKGTTITCTFQAES
jgi:two-component system, chemotaxis family, CheB/CheR fusion protein